jgi:hypothetical protein
MKGHDVMATKPTLAKQHQLLQRVNSSSDYARVCDLTLRTGQIAAVGRLPDDSGWQCHLEGGNFGSLSPV